MLLGDKFSKAFDFHQIGLVNVQALHTLHVTETGTLSSDGIKKIIFIIEKFTQIYL
jgi:hypothetical protein